MADLLHMPFFEQNCSKSCYLNCNKTMQLIIIAPVLLCGDLNTRVRNRKVECIILAIYEKNSSQDDLERRISSIHVDSDDFGLTICVQKLNTHIGPLYVLVSAPFSYCLVRYFEFDAHVSHSFVCTSWERKVQSPFIIINSIVIHLLIFYYTFSTFFCSCVRQ